MTQDPVLKATHQLSFQLAKKFFEQKPEVIPDLDKAVKNVIVGNGLAYTLSTFRAMREGMDIFVTFMNNKSPEIFASEQFRNSFLMRMYIDFLIGREDEKVAKILDNTPIK